MAPNSDAYAYYHTFYDSYTHADPYTYVSYNRDTYSADCDAYAVASVIRNGMDYMGWIA